MKKQLVLAGVVLSLIACSHEGSSPSSKGDLGTGLNTIGRKYNKPASETYDASVAAVKSFDLTVDLERHDEMGGEVAARRADGSKVTILVETVDKVNSRAVVRVEPGDSTLATMIHEKIADKLGMGAAKAAFFGGNSEEFPYAATMEAGAEAADRTFKALGWTVTGKEIKDNWVKIDARAEDSNPARIKIERITERAFTSRVTFIAGHGNTDLSKAMIIQMHDEFDRQIGGHVR